MFRHRDDLLEVGKRAVRRLDRGAEGDVPTIAGGRRDISGQEHVLNGGHPNRGPVLRGLSHARLKAVDHLELENAFPLDPGYYAGVEWERVLKLQMVDGFEPRVGQTAKDRPAVRVPAVQNMFLAGDVAAAPGNGGDVAFGSAVEAAHCALAYLK